MNQIETLNSFLTFRLGDELFAANVSKVLEILQIPTITKVPRSPDFMRGVINLRGNVLPVIDTRAKFGLPQKDNTVDTCIVVINVSIEGSQITIGALTDSVEEVIELEAENILEAPTIGTKYKTGFIQGMVKKGDQFIMILDLDKVFSVNEGTIIQEIVSSRNGVQ